MPHFWINQRYFPQPKVCGLLRNGVRHAPFYCAACSVLSKRLINNDRVLLRGKGTFYYDCRMKNSGSYFFRCTLLKIIFLNGSFDSDLAGTG
jgi:hypothetical protein